MRLLNSTSIFFSPPFKFQIIFNSFNFNLYPNPCTSFSTILFENAENTISIKITDISGKIIFNKIVHFSQGENEYNLDLNSVQPGIYLCSIQTKNKIVTKRINKI